MWMRKIYIYIVMLRVETGMESWQRSERRWWTKRWARRQERSEKRRGMGAAFRRGIRTREFTFIHRSSFIFSLNYIVACWLNSGSSDTSEEGILWKEKSTSPTSSLMFLHDPFISDQHHRINCKEYGSLNQLRQIIRDKTACNLNDSKCAVPRFRYMRHTQDIRIKFFEFSTQLIGLWSLQIGREWIAIRHGSGK